MTREKRDIDVVAFCRINFFHLHHFCIKQLVSTAFHTLFELFEILHFTISPNTIFK